jgi:hypothetical protein
VVVVGDQEAFAEDLGLQCFAGGIVDVPGQGKVGRRGPGELGAQHPRHPARVGDPGYLGLDSGGPAAGLAAGQGRGQLAQGPGGLGQGLVEAGRLGGVQVRGVGQDDPPVGAEHERAGVVGAQSWVLLGVDAAKVAGASQ